MKQQSILTPEANSRAVAHEKGQKNAISNELSSIQAKLTVGEPDDQYEQEADNVADTVMSMPEPQVSRTAGEDEEKLQTKPLSARITPLIQRQPEEEESLQAKLIQRESQEEEERLQTKLIQLQTEEEEEPLQAKYIQRKSQEEEEKLQAKLIHRQPEKEEEPVQSKLIQKQPEEEEEPVQTKLISRKEEKSTATDASWLDDQLQGTKGSGNPLPDYTRANMENRFGSDFCQVKVHTDGNAVSMNKELGAQAFTHGNDIYFNSGMYNPGISSGNHLLAHELTHVVQQNNGLKRVSRATYTVGNSRVNIDYGNVVYFDNNLQHQNQIELKYTNWTGQPATGIHADVANLSNSKRRWLLFAIDLLTDNPLSSLNKVSAVRQLIDYAPNSTNMPLDGNDWHNPVFNFENEVLRVCGWFELALTSGLTMPSAQDQRLLDFAYNHDLTSTSASGSTCPATRSASQQLKETRLRTDLPPLVRAFLQRDINNLTSRGIQLHNTSDILPIADIVQREALQFFSPYIGRGSSKNFLQTWSYSANIASSTAPNAIPVEARKFYLANRANGVADDNDLFRQVNYDPRCGGDIAVFNDIVDQLNNDATVQAQLNSIMSWQSFTAHNDDKANTVLNLQYFSDQNACTQRWKLVNSLCHELVHAYGHSGFYDMAHGRRIVTEGFTEILGDQLYTSIRTKANRIPAYRGLFEAGLSAGACLNIAIPEAETGYGEDGRFALGIRGIVGDDRFRAAYFLGQTRLAGLQPKLIVGGIDDAFEQEADNIADKVTNKTSENSSIRPVHEASHGNGRMKGNNNYQQQPNVSAMDVAGNKILQRKPKPSSDYNKALVENAKARLKVLEPKLAELEVKEFGIEVERLRVIADRNKLDDNAADPVMPLKKKMEEDNLTKLNLAPLDILITDTAVVFTVKFQIWFMDNKMNNKFDELKTNVQAGINLVWNQKLEGVFAGRPFFIVPSFTLINDYSQRDKNFWIIAVRKVSTGAPVTYPGGKLDQPDPSMPTSVTDPNVDGGVMSIPPSHINKPGVLGHEMIHLFGLVDRYFTYTTIKPGKKSTTSLVPTRDTTGRKDPLGGQDGTILREDLGYLFSKLGVYSREKTRNTQGLGALKREVMRLQEIVKLGYDPNSLIPSVIRKDFTDKMIKDVENL